MFSEARVFYEFKKRFFEGIAIFLSQVIILGFFHPITN
jgi:hypothetical protein